MNEMIDGLEVGRKEGESDPRGRHLSDGKPGGGAGWRRQGD